MATSKKQVPSKRKPLPHKKGRSFKADSARISNEPWEINRVRLMHYKQDPETGNIKHPTREQITAYKMPFNGLRAKTYKAMAAAGWLRIARISENR